jgi:hypothetical protein
MNKFEKLIEYIINDEDQKARELFHTIVVEKSRDIYESLMDEENMEETVHGNMSDVVDEVDSEESATMEDDEDSEEEFSLDHDEEGDDGEVGGHMPPMGDHDPEEEEHAEIEDKVMNIDAKLDELLAKFDDIMGGGDEPGMEHDEPEVGPMDEMPMMEADEEEEESYDCDHCKDKGCEKCDDDHDDDKKMDEGKNPFAKKSDKEAKRSKSTTELMREYVDRIGDIYGGAGDAAEGDAVGAAGKKTAVNTKYTGKQDGPDFGGNVVKASTKSDNQDGTTPTKANNEYNKGQGQLIGKVGNTPGGDKKLQSTGKEYSKSHDSEGKTTDGSVPVAKKSVQAQNTGKK